MAYPKLVTHSLYFLGTHRKLLSVRYELKNRRVDRVLVIVTVKIAKGGWPVKCYVILCPPTQIKLGRLRGWWTSSSAAKITSAKCLQNNRKPLAAGCNEWLAGWLWVVVGFHLVLVGEWWWSVCRLVNNEETFID